MKIREQKTLFSSGFTRWHKMIYSQYSKFKDEMGEYMASQETLENFHNKTIVQTFVELFCLPIRKK
jgi:hypothetical protein